MTLKTVIINVITFEVIYVIKEVKKFDVRRVDSYELKEDLRRTVGNESLVDEKNFILLLLSRLASKSKLSYTKGKNSIKKGALPINYRDAINSIMHNEYAIKKYSDIIDIYKYYIDYPMWRQDMVKEIDSILDSNMYDYEFCYTDGTIIINFKRDDLNRIRKLVDEDTLKKFDDFADEFINYYKEEEKKLKKIK